MALITKAIKGTQDVLPSESHKNQFIESTLLNIAKDFGFREIRTPVFEHTELFTRSVGDTTIRAAVRLPSGPRERQVQQELSLSTGFRTSLCRRKSAM